MNSEFVFSVKTELLNSGALSRLYIANAARKDSGNYTCALEDVSATTVSVHVLKGRSHFFPFVYKFGVKINSYFSRINYGSFLCAMSEIKWKKNLLR